VFNGRAEAYCELLCRSSEGPCHQGVYDLDGRRVETQRHVAGEELTRFRVFCDEVEGLFRRCVSVASAQQSFKRVRQLGQDLLRRGAADAPKGDSAQAHGLHAALLPQLPQGVEQLVAADPQPLCNYGRRHTSRFLNLFVHLFYAYLSPNHRLGPPHAGSLLGVGEGLPHYVLA
jgi:hypothetical protein